MNGIETQRIGKLEAAHRQLTTAIELWFNNGDIVSIHTLACAAHQIIHDVNSKKGGRDLIFDSIIIKDEYRNEACRLLRKHMNFFKHADNDPHTEIDCPLEMSIGFLMFSLLGLELLGEKFNDVDRAFLLWYQIHNPEHLTDHGLEMLEQHLSKEQLVVLQAAPRDEFLGAFMRRESPGNRFKTSFLTQ
ncbi:MAG: hypothetical protein IH830_04450 [Planctomycetes bacterium]|nr:hypothetical protein [Planctomycetota bacterium]